MIIILFIILVPSVLCAEDIKGLQPFQTYGVFSTFSAESLGAKGLGLGINLERTKNPDFYRITAQAAYGLRDNMELHLNLPYFLKYDQSIYGFEDVTLGFKHRFVDEGRYGPALAYILIVSPGLGRSEFSTDGRIGAGMIVTKKVGPFKGHTNLIIYEPFKSGLNREYLLNMGVELAIAHSSKILAELVSRKNYFINRIDLLEWRVGYRQEIADGTFVNLGGGFDIKDRKPDYRFLFSLNYIIDLKKREIKKIYEQ